MVLQQVSPRMRGFDPGPSRPDAVRIVGLAGTIAFNAVVLSVLLVPTQRPDAASTSQERPQEFRWITPPPPTPPRPPERVEIVTPPRVATPSTPALPTRTPVAPRLEQAAVVDAGALPALDTGPAIISPSVESPVAATGPVTGVSLQYASAPAPAYPRDALRRGAEGVVYLEILVDSDGRPLEVRVHRSSGHRDLDQHALRHVQRHWTFQPALRDGRPVEAIGIVPIAFDLGRG